MHICNVEKERSDSLCDERDEHAPPMVNAATEALARNTTLVWERKYEIGLSMLLGFAEKSPNEKALLHD